MSTKIQGTIAGAPALSASIQSVMILNDWVLTIEKIDGGHRLTARRGTEVQSMDVMDGQGGGSFSASDDGNGNVIIG